MLVSLIRPEILSPLEGWSYYGAHQLLEIAGVPFEVFEVTDGSNLSESQIVVIPNASHPNRLVGVAKRALREGKVVVVGCDIALALLQNNISIGAMPVMPTPLVPDEPSDLLPLKAYALLPVAFTETTLPLLGEPLILSPSSRSLGFARSLDGRRGGLVFIENVEGGTLVVLGGRIFETCGLILSRFSWFAHPHRRDSLLHKVDLLWDEQLKPWHRFPVVSFYAQFLLWLLSAILWERGQILPIRWCLPQENEMPFKMALTALHDVEIIYDDPVWKRSDNPNYRFAEWLDLEQRLGIRSAFFFLSPVTALPPHWHLNYDISDEPVLAALDLIEERYGEIGLLSIAHASENALAMERERLEEIGDVFVWGVRSYKFGNTPASIRHKSAVGFAYDSSWFAGQNEPSFLTGCAHPFRPLDTERWQVLPIVELSAVLDDRVLLGELAGSQRDGDATHLGIQFCETVFALNGMACLSWQQHNFNQSSKVFEQIVRHCIGMTQNSLWFPSPKEIAQWWSIRNEVKVHAKPVGKRWWKVEIKPPEELDEALAFVLGIPAMKEIRAVEEGKVLTVNLLGSLGRMKVWGVPLTLEPNETFAFSIGVLP
ncbi:MAG: hypothetical protein NZ805_14760 [Armatimonadetes bacterium]|nr:hypothetical protein [Armatimonadota bacterium]MDW8029534.1 hypothetical protein [Armatimonadota bacterium]